MPILDNYHQFDGLHWETGSIRNYLDYRGVKAPHTGHAYSEAMLMGISGGAVMGYFSFAYKGHDPHVRILTRNTFDPLDKVLERLGIVQTRLQTSKSERALSNLIDTLEEGVPAITWADMFSLPYNHQLADEGMWAMFPLVVYGYDQEAGEAWIADRSQVPLMITTEELRVARSRIKKFKSRILRLDPPKPDKLPSAVQMGIWDCIKLYTEAPPKGSRSNFGFAAYERWADLLTKPKQKMSWEKEFPAGSKMYAGLTSAFYDINIFGKDGYAERDVFADFLDEASTVLQKPVLKEAAEQFRKSANAWAKLSMTLLPDTVPSFKESRMLMMQSHHQFLERGGGAINEIRRANQRLGELKEALATDFPIDEHEVIVMRETIRDKVIAILDIERAAIEILKEAMS
jgi:hypothetical protein